MWRNWKVPLLLDFSLTNTNQHPQEWLTKQTMIHLCQFHNNCSGVNTCVYIVEITPCCVRKQSMCCVCCACWPRNHWLRAWSLQYRLSGPVPGDRCQWCGHCVSSASHRWGAGPDNTVTMLSCLLASHRYTSTHINQPTLKKAASTPAESRHWRWTNTGGIICV